MIALPSRARASQPEASVLRISSESVAVYLRTTASPALKPVLISARVGVSMPTSTSRSTGRPSSST